MTQTDPSPHDRVVEPAPGTILTVSELKRRLDRAFESGIHPDTAVVVAQDGWYDELDADIGDPTSVALDDEYIWFTLTPHGPADARFTPSNVRPDRSLANTDSPTDVVGWAMQAFWGDPEQAYKASEYDAVFHAAQALEAAGFAWSAAAVRRAADVGYVMGQYGVDQKTDRQYHAVIAATILETEDV